jgi:hypothetical protein
VASNVYQALLRGRSISGWGDGGNSGDDSSGSGGGGGAGGGGGGDHGEVALPVCLAGVVLSCSTPVASPFARCFNCKECGTLLTRFGRPGGSASGRVTPRGPERKPGTSICAEVSLSPS